MSKRGAPSTAATTTAKAKRPAPMGKENARPDAKMRYVEEPGTFADLVVELGKPSATAGKFVLNLADEELKKNLTFPSFMHASKTTPLAKLKAESSYAETEVAVMLKRMDENNANLTKKLEEVEAKNADLTKKLEKVDADLTKKLEEVEAKNADLTKKLEDVTKKFEEVEAKNASLTKEVEELKAENANFTKKFEEVEAKNASLTKKLEEVEELLKATNEVLKSGLAQVVDTQDKMRSGV